MADWNPKTDPYYASLYDQTPFDFIDSYRASEKYLQQQEQQDLLNETNQIKIQDARDKLSQKTALSEALKQGGDYREKARQIYIENGDIEGLTKLDKEIVDEKYKNILADKQELENILNLPPDVAMERYNSGRLGQSGPKVTNMNDLYKANRKLQGSVAGGIFSQDPATGEPIIHTQPQYKPDSGRGNGDNVNLITVIDPKTGQLKRVSPKNPTIFDNGEIPYSDSAWQTVKQNLENQKLVEEEDKKANAPGMLSNIGSYLQNLGKTKPPPQQAVPNDNSLNGAYKGQGPVKNGVVTLRKKPEFNKGIGQQ